MGHGWPVVRLVERLVGRLVERLVGRLVERMVERLGVKRDSWKR